MVSVTVVRGALSMAFFAFVFASLLSLSIAIINDHKLPPFDVSKIRTILKLVVFVALFLFIMKWAWFHNWMSNQLLGTLTHDDRYPQLAKSFFAFTFSAVFALSNTILNDYLDNRRLIRTLLRLALFATLFIVLVWAPWLHPTQFAVLEWLRIERQ